MKEPESNSRDRFHTGRRHLTAKTPNKTTHCPLPHAATYIHTRTPARKEKKHPRKKPMSSLARFPRMSVCLQTAAADKPAIRPRYLSRSSPGHVSVRSSPPTSHFVSFQMANTNRFLSIQSISLQLSACPDASCFFFLKSSTKRTQDFLALHCIALHESTAPHRTACV